MCEQIKLSGQWIASLGRARRYALRILTAIVTVYIVFLLWLLPEMMEEVPMDTKYWPVKIAVSLIMLVPVYLALRWCEYRFADVKVKSAAYESAPDCSAAAGRKGDASDPEADAIEDHLDAASKKISDRKRRIFWFAVGAVIVFAVMMVWFYAFFPGSFDLDNSDQWWQIQNSQYDTWHPVFHTLIIAFFTLFINNYWFPVFMQLLIYSLLCGYMMYTLAKWDFPRWSLVLTEVFLAFNPQTHRLLLYMWKDSMLTIFMLLFAVYLINVWKTGGEWLRKKRNMLVWVLVLIAISMVRHNSILYTIPFLIMGIIFFGEVRKRMIASLVLMLAGMWIIEYPVYDLVGASRPEQAYAESVGVPMTILCNIYATDPDALDEAALEFIEQIGPEKRWDTYEMGNYNSMKFVSNANNLVKETEPLEFLGMTLRTIIKSPGLSLQAFYQVTRMVWDIRGDEAWHEDLQYQIVENEWNFTYVDSRAQMRTVLEDFDEWMFDGVIDYAFSYNGVHLLVLILVTLFVFAKKGWKAMTITLPLLCYSYGTALLLCGPTYRFFHFNSVIFIPLCLLLLTEWGGKPKTNLDTVVDPAAIKSVE